MPINTYTQTHIESYMTKKCIWITHLLQTDCHRFVTFYLVSICMALEYYGEKKRNWRAHTHLPAVEFIAKIHILILSFTQSFQLCAFAQKHSQILVIIYCHAIAISH